MPADLRPRIDNPLKRYRPEQLDKVAESFATNFEFVGLEDLFKKAARCARDPAIAHVVPGLTDYEKKELQCEDGATFWGHPKQLKIVIIACSLGAILQ